MIGLKTFAENLQTKLNGNNSGLTFVIKADSKQFDKAVRTGNVVNDRINGLLTLQASDMSNLTSGELFATISCRLQVIFRLKGGVGDEDEEIIKTENGKITFNGYKTSNGGYTIGHWTSDISLTVGAVLQYRNATATVINYNTSGEYYRIRYEEGNAFDDISENEQIDVIVKTVVQIIEGNNTYIERVRDALSNAFQRNEQSVMTENGKNYLVCILYQFVETGIRDQQSPIGDCMSFTAYISYMLVENGLNTHDIVYTLDGKIIPFQTNTVYRTPTMDANVPANSANGAVKNLASQSIFSISFQLPALRNEITRRMFEWLFGGELNVAHILGIKYPTFSGDTSQEKFYLMTYGENNASGETIKNVGQTLTLVECWNDYELVGIPSGYYVYYTSTAKTSIRFAADAYYYIFTPDGIIGFAGATQSISKTIPAGTYLMATAALSPTTGWTVVQNG